MLARGCLLLLLGVAVCCWAWRFITYGAWFSLVLACWFGCRESFDLPLMGCAGYYRCTPSFSPARYRGLFPGLFEFARAIVSSFITVFDAEGVRENVREKAFRLHQGSCVSMFITVLA